MSVFGNLLSFGGGRGRSQVLAGGSESLPPAPKQEKPRYSRQDQDTFAAVLEDVHPYADNLIKLMGDVRVRPQFREMLFELLVAQDWSRIPFKLPEHLRSEGGCLHQMDTDALQALSPEQRERFGQIVLNRLVPLHEVPEESLKRADLDHQLAYKLAPHVSLELATALAKNYSLLKLQEPAFSRLRIEKPTHAGHNSPENVRKFIADGDIPLSVRKIVLDRFAEVVIKAVPVQVSAADRPPAAEVFHPRALLCLLLDIGRFGWSGASTSDFDAEVVRAMRDTPEPFRYLADYEFRGLLSGTTPGGQVQQRLADALMTRWLAEDTHLNPENFFNAAKEEGKEFISALAGNEALLQKFEAVKQLFAQRELERLSAARKSDHQTAVEWNEIVQRLT